MTENQQQLLFNGLIEKHGGLDNLSPIQIEIVSAIVRALIALQTSHPIEAPQLAASIAKMTAQLPPPPEAAVLDLTRLNDPQLDALEEILAVASGEKPKFDLSKIDDQQLSILRRARRIMDGKDPGGPEPVPARDAELAAKVANLQAQLAALLELNQALEARLALYQEAAA